MQQPYQKTNSFLFNSIHRIAKQHILVKNMQAVERLCHANVIVIDAMGIIMRNEMVVSRVFADEAVWHVSGKGYDSEGSLFLNNKQVKSLPESDLFRMAQGLSLLNSTTIAGDPTQAALFVFSQKIRIDPKQLEQEFEKLYEIPFEVKHNYHAAFFIHDGQGVAFIAGLPELIFARSKPSSHVQQVCDELLSSGLSVIAVGVKYFALPARDPLYFEQLIAHDVTFLGLCGIEDSIRAEVPATIAKARRAGFQIIMATGDHQRTALAIAKEVGIYNDGDEAINGPELDTLSDAQLQEVITHVTVFSRMSPEQKLRIFDALHAHNLIVAMAGDGIHDAPSLVTLIHAIEESRHTIYTMRGMIAYFFSTIVAAILIILFVFAVAVFYPDLYVTFPLTIAQIVWVNVVTVGFLGSALAREKKEKGLLFEQQWLKKKQVIYTALPMAFGSLFMFILYSQYDLVLARTMTLVTLGMFQWFNAWNCRSNTKSIFQIGLLSNRRLLGALAIIFILQLLLLHVPFLQRIFATQPLNIYQWIFVTIMSSSVIWLEEIRKWFVRKQEA